MYSRKKPKVYNFADGTREVTWRWSRRNGRHWCDLKVIVGTDGVVQESTYERTNSQGGLELCGRIQNFG